MGVGEASQQFSAQQVSGSMQGPEVGARVIGAQSSTVTLWDHVVKEWNKSQAPHCYAHRAPACQ